MAILKKRTSSKQLPEARGLDRAPLGSIIRGVGDTPNLTGRGSSSITSAGGSGGSNAVQSAGSETRPFTSAFTNPDTNRPAITSKPATTTKPSLTTKTSLNTKPSLTSKTGTPTTKTTTTKPTTTNKPTITNKTSTTPTTKTTSPTSVVKPTVKPNTSNPNSTTNKIVNALTGAAIGAGTKLIIDKITGKPTVVGGGSNTGGTGKTGSGSTAGSNTGSKTGSNTGSKTGSNTGPTVNPKSGTGSPTSVVKNPVTGLPSGTGFGDDKTEYTTDSLGNTYKTMPDGTSVLYRAAEVDEDITPDTGGGTRGLGGTTTAGDAENTDTVVAGGDTEYFQDDEGNYYVMNDDGGYDLAYYADGSAYEDTYTDDTTVADNTYTDPDTGAVWTMADNGEWSTDFNYDDYYANEDYALADNTDYMGNDDYLYAGNDDYTDYDYTDYSDYDYAKSGGLITMMKNGGVPRFAGGNLVTEDGLITNYAYNDETGDLYQPMAQNEYGDYYRPVLGNRGYTTSSPVSLSESLSDGEEVVNTSYGGNDFTPAPGRQYFDDGSYIDTFDDGSTMTYDSDGNLAGTTDGYQTTRDDEGNYIVTDGYGNMTVYDPSGSVIPLGGGRVNKRPITSAGGGNRTSTVGNVLNPNANAGSNNLGSDFLNTITGALGTTAGAAGAGALIASLLGGDFGGGTGNQNQGLDMSKVGIINPRTTDFGIGPTNFVDYQDYGTSGDDYTPNEELLRNLNAPGYNPVNEGDYGYEELAADEAETTPKMASGGLSSMATPVASYYTFGQPADILANLGMRAQPPMNPPEMMSQIGQQQQPQQAQQQGLPQQAPPLAPQQMQPMMPQQGMMPQQQGMPPPMRKGGLPHVSNVPMVEGRMDFRQGSAVHGAGDGQSDDIPAMLADGEYVIDAETVAQIGNGSTKAGAQALDKFREGIRAHKRSAPLNKIPPKTKALTSYLKGAK